MNEYTKNGLIINTDIGTKEHLIVRNNHNKMIHIDLENNIFETFKNSNLTSIPMSEDDYRILDYAINHLDSKKDLETCLQIIYEHAIIIFNK